MIHQVRTLCGIALTLVAIQFISCPLVWGQDATTGQIVGSVTDSTDAVIPNVEVTVKNMDNGQTRTVPSNAAGRYVAPLLAPGNYMVAVAVTGFAPLSKGPINVPAGTST